jgi:hypothetical protein
MSLMLFALETMVRGTAGRPVHPLCRNTLLTQDDPESLASLKLECEGYLNTLKRGGLHCFNTKNGLSACKCLTRIASPAVMSNIIIRHLQQKKRIQDIRIVEWLRSNKALKVALEGKKKSKFTSRGFFQSGAKDIDGQPLFLCRNAVVEIFCVGYYRMGNISKYIGLAELPKHGLTGKVPSWNDTDSRKSCDDALIIFFDDLTQQGESHATRVVREKTKVGLRDGDVDLVELPSAMTKRNLYEQFCFSRGYKMQVSANGSYGPLKLAEVRGGHADADDESWPVGSIPLPICSYGYFWKFWKKEYPKLGIRPPSRDTCDECFQYSNVLGQHKRAQNEIERQVARDLSAAQEVDGDEDEDDEDERLVLDESDTEEQRDDEPGQEDVLIQEDENELDSEGGF